MTDEPAPAPPLRLTRTDYLWLAGLAALVLGAALVWAAVAQRPDGRLHLYMLDVGQGDALLLTTPGGHTVMVDGGPDPTRITGLLGRHLPFWQHTIDLMVLTHPHADHIAGLIEVMSHYQVGGVLETPYTMTDALETAWTTDLKAQHIPFVAAVRGQTVTVEPGLSLRVLAPDPALLHGTNSDINNSSVVLRLTYGRVSMLLTGDIETAAVLRLLADTAATPDLPLQAAVLKVPHHGSATGLSTALLAAIHPQVALISVGAGNTYGHPALVTLDTLAAAQVPTYRTDLNGTVDVSSDGARLWIQTER